MKHQGNIYCVQQYNYIYKLDETLQRIQGKLFLFDNRFGVSGVQF